MRSRSPIFASLAVSLMLTGCLSNSYRVHPDELQRIARLPPDQHGGAIRATQGFLTSSQPPEQAPQIVLVDSDPLYTSVGPVGPVHGRGGHGGGGHGGGGHGGGGAQTGSASLDADMAAVLVFLAVLASVGLAVSEGARYDGWVATDPNTPLYLHMPEGWRQLPLGYLDDATAARADYGVLLDRGTRFQRLERAPLDRVGMTYSVDLGAGRLDGQGLGDSWGFSSRISFGGFFLPWLGVVGTLGLAWSDDGLDTIFVGRYGGEVQAFPLAIDRVHFGGYVGGGYQRAKRDVNLDATLVRSTPYYSVGGIVQLELTTRMALTLRGGESVIAAVGGGVLMSPELSVGLAIY
ncbi:MAG: hypothetical protein GXP55_03130 [Deltaproteobacteria bacterium]|nr:hypothetical protein [Deltaproteobacteria bacterium]